MNAPPTRQSLEISRTFAASCERVYRAWTDPEAFAAWFAPSSDYVVVLHTFEPRVGGTYRVEMRHSAGKNTGAITGRLACRSSAGSNAA